jgi:hypothetical protein
VAEKDRSRNSRGQKTLRERIEGRIARKRGEDVFLPREFADLGGEESGVAGAA